jgi:hypothetical protein
MSVLEYLTERRGISEAQIRSITQLVTCPVYEVRLWKRRRLLVSDFEVVAAS